MLDSAALADEILPAAEALLSQSLRHTVKFVSAELLGGPRPRSHVWRCRWLDPVSGVAQSAILKCARGFDAPKYDAEAARRLAREYASARLLNENLRMPLAPSVTGIDRAHGYILLEDLGAGGNLADALLGAHAGAADLFERYADALAAQHAVTLGKQADFDALVARVRDPADAAAPLSLATEHTPTEWLCDDVPAFLAINTALGLSNDRRMLEEARGIAATLIRRPERHAFSSGDCCPDNHIVTATGDICFIDFEKGCFRHPLLDLAYLHMPFPTCWCVNRLPDIAVTHAETAYRARIVTVCPEFADDDVFCTELARCCAFWAIRSLFLRPDKGFDLPAVLIADAAWGRASLRQRHVLRLQNAATLCARTAHLSALGAAFQRLGELLAGRWGAAAGMPLYPAFR